MLTHTLDHVWDRNCALGIADHLVPASGIAGLFLDVKQASEEPKMLTVLKGSCSLSEVFLKVSYCQGLFNSKQTKEELGPKAVSKYTGPHFVPKKSQAFNSDPLEYC